MTAFLSSPHLADLILIVFAIEASVLTWLWHTHKRGLSPAQFWPMAAAGVMLVIALRLALGGASWMPIAACLLAAGIAHGIDVMMRWRNEPTVIPGRRASDEPGIH